MKTQAQGQQLKSDTILGEQVREESLDSAKMPFSAPGFSSTNVKGAIMEAKGASSENFSFRKVKQDKTVTILDDQQMIVLGALEISGALIIEGELCVL